MGNKESNLKGGAADEEFNKGALAFVTAFEEQYLERCELLKRPPNRSLLDSIRAQARAVEPNSYTFELVLRNVAPLEDVEVDAIAKAVGNSKSRQLLSGLNMDGCGMDSAENVDTIVECLAGNTKLTYLDLSGNRIDSQASMERLADVVRENPHLRTLRLAGCHVSDEAALALGERLLASTRWLRRVDLRRNSFRADSIKRLVDLVESNPALIALDVDHALVPQEDRQRLQRCLDRNNAVMSVVDHVFESSCKRQFKTRLAKFRESAVQRARSAEKVDTAKQQGSMYKLISSGNKKDIHNSNSMRFDTGFAATTGKRSEMQDVVLMLGSFPDFYAVFDGHGGRTAARSAANLLPETFRRLYGEARRREHGHLDPDPNPDQLDRGSPEKAALDALEQAFVECDNQISPFCTNLGTTATVAVVIQNFVYLANVGDSRAIVCLENGDVRQLTVDHKPEEEGERRRLQEVKAVVINDRLAGRLAVSRALGDSDLRGMGVSAVPYLTWLNLREEPFTHLILASDGVWDVLSHEEVRDFVTDHNDASVAAERIRDQALIAGSQDNIGLCIVNLATASEV